MTELLLDSLEISNFKTFKHLRIEHLGRVNLVVGQNGAGKTALLEALRLYANGGSFQAALDILQARHELNGQTVSDNRIEDEAVLKEAVSNLFYDRQDINTARVTAKIGSLRNQGREILVEIDRASNNFIRDGEASFQDSALVYAATVGKSPGTYQALERGEAIKSASLEPQIPNNFVGTGGIEPAEARRLWSSLTSTNLETSVIIALRIIVPKLERVVVPAEPATFTPLIGIENESKPVVIQSLGDGLSRVFGIVLALVNSNDGILLVDGIENSLHFSTLLGLWRLIFGMARRLNIQVFATTHSWDCIEAFQKAALEDPELGMLIRLDKNEGEITPILLDENRLKILTRKEIEVR